MNSTQPNPSTRRTTRTVILGVAASDAHVVANKLIEGFLSERGFDVVNLGVNTSIAEFCDAYAAHPDAEAVIIGSLNGHAYEDLRGLAEARSGGRLGCPVILGGNLSVGSRKARSSLERLYHAGVDYILGQPEEIPPLLNRLRLEGEQADHLEVAS